MRVIAEVLKALKTRAVTSKYPLKPAEVCEGLRGKILYEKAKCVGCFNCVRFCPSPAVFPTDEKKVKFDMGRCIFCAMCQEVCPVKCIHLTKEFEMATGDLEKAWVKG